jgi:undecaprenyl-diphosphatase
MAGACSGGVDTGFATLDFGQMAVLGVVQGITELLPISSTAHMRIVPAMLGWRDPGSAFSALMQLAALGAIVSYFWRDIVGLFTGTWAAITRGETRSVEFLHAVGVVFATVPIVIGGLALSKALNTCDSPLRALWVIGASSLAMAILLGLTEILASHRRGAETAKLRDFLMIGLAQVGALIPGVSRSGSTLTAALALGFKRADAARLSFIIGLPAIFLAGAKEALELYKAHLDAHAWTLLGVGLLCGAASAFVAIWGLMRFFEHMSSWIFVAYRAALGAFLLFGVYAGWIG